MPAPLSPTGLRRRLLALTLAAGSVAAVAVSAAPADAARTGTASVDGAEVSCTSQTAHLAPRLAKDIAGALHGRQGTSALALDEPDTATHCTLRGETPFDSASVVKVTVLATLLRHAQEEHRGLTAHEKSLATAMITRSDNDSTSALWKQLGPDSVRRFLHLAGMRHTVPPSGGTWGLTQITAADQLRLLHLLTGDNTVLSAASRHYALGLMHRVEPSQRWGVPAGAPAGERVYLKNGWLPRSSGGWRVHSVGAFSGGGHSYELAALTGGDRTMQYGIGTVEAAARVIHRDLAAADRP
ncbi:serine hydrolase [Streptomyces sp. NPDC059740]|uniref:serine hydrolase n=1 Tax=Streptomyces sp. NPDC059740 TaxID=3346926 RepID=UPI00365C4373